MKAILLPILMLSSCSPDITIMPRDVGPNACGAVAICESDMGCAGEQICTTDFCLSDKGTMAHWCVCKEPNPGIGICASASDCPPENVCWSWACSSGHCQAVGKDGGV